MSDLIDRLRRAVEQNAREGVSPLLPQPPSSEVTCSKVTDIPTDPTNSTYSNWCGEVHEGHRCRWSTLSTGRGGPGVRGTHDGYVHECGCGAKWGPGRAAWR